eukprot:UN21871
MNNSPKRFHAHLHLLITLDR